VLVETDEQVIRCLREELSSLTVPAAPVCTVIQRGRGIKARRRAFAAASVTAASAAIAAAVSAQVFAAVIPTAAAGLAARRDTSRTHPPGVFAAGTAAGKRWQLAVRNVAGTGADCQPAVMLNGHTGDVLVRHGSGAQPITSPAFLAVAPGFGSTGFAFVQVTHAVTSVTLSTVDGGQQRRPPVTVSACGRRYQLAGFAVAGLRRGVKDIIAQPPATAGIWVPPAGLFKSRPPIPGMWVNPGHQPLVAEPATAMIGAGRVAGHVWSIAVSLGTDGQCYSGRLSRNAATPSVTYCVPVEAAPADGVSFARVGLPLPSPEPLTGYAAVVSQGATYAIATFSRGVPQRVTVHRVSGRSYLAMALPPGVKVTSLSLYGTGGQLSVTRYLFSRS
jgi:hypothetical protein